MSEEIRSVLVGTAGLAVAAGIALLLTLTRLGVVGSAEELRATVRVAVIAILAQAAHFAEELATGFPRLFPAALGLTPWPTGFFVPFNVAWLAIWGVAVAGLTARLRAALFPLWFLALAGLANGLAHPALALRVGGYFPGLVTSPLVAVAGVLLLRRLSRVTGDGESRAQPG